MKLTTINPATEEIIKNYDSAKVQDIPNYINNSKKAAYRALVPAVKISVVLFYFLRVWLFFLFFFWLSGY